MCCWSTADTGKPITASSGCQTQATLEAVGICGPDPDGAVGPKGGGEGVLAC